MQETRIQSLECKDPLEKEMATHSSILVWRILWTMDPGKLSPWDCKELETTEQLSHYTQIIIALFIITKSSNNSNVYQAMNK